MPRWGRSKSNTKYVSFRGKAVYVKPYVPDEYNGKETWKCGMTVTKEEWQKLKESGSQLKKRLSENIPNIDEDTPYVVFNRDAEKEFRTGKVYFCPPVIYDQDGNKLVWYEDADGKEVKQFSEDSPQPERKGEPVIIGNGSDIEVTVSIYPAGSFGHGTRLESIRIIDLIEWIPPEDGSDTQSSAVNAKTPTKSETSKKTEKKPSIKKDEKPQEDQEDDEIPFDTEGEIGW